MYCDNTMSCWIWLFLIRLLLLCCVSFCSWMYCVCDNMMSCWIWLFLIWLLLLCCVSFCSWMYCLCECVYVCISHMYKYPCKSTLNTFGEGVTVGYKPSIWALEIKFRSSEKKVILLSADPFLKPSMSS